MRLVEERNNAARLNPRPVTLIGASYNGEVGFATVAWISPLSHDPPLLAFSLRATSHTFKLIEDSGWCSVNVPHAASLETVMFCGNNSGFDVDKKASVPFRLLKDSPYERLMTKESGQAAHLPELPLLEEARSILLVHTVSIAPAGDHMLVVTEVASAFSQCLTDDKGRVIATDTLLCLQHDLFTTAGAPIRAEPQ
jgi:flavin reductase (DIM6/NTAB) family NADH-FMN oxidoreductase RutF